MSETRNSSGFIAFTFFFLLFLAGSVSLQESAIKGSIDTFFPNYEFFTNVIPGEWVVMSRNLSQSEYTSQQREHLNDLFYTIRAGELNPTDATMNVLLGKKRIREHAMQTEQTLYFINPFIAFFPLHIFVASLLAFLLSMFIPVEGDIAWIRKKLYREINHIYSLLRKQFEAHNVDFLEMIQLPRQKREELLLFTTLPEVVIFELTDYISVRDWVEKKVRNPFIPLKFYFRYRISASYGNLIQGLVSGGAAILIFVIGLRGLKLIPAEEPSLILMALSIEFILLIILMITFAGSAQEERLDRVVKELEAEQRDALKQQTDTLHDVLSGSVAKGGGGVTTTDSIAEYEEQRLLDEILSMMLKEAEKKRTS
ncbi:MAG: hypothetical protein M5R41_15730 [Bacteroidia bacterium]|nr:hypothetical protein [Bacteroidia bacterium]